MSLFTEALADLLDKTAFFSRAEWADFLMIKEALIDRWLAEKDLPKPYWLHMIWLALETSSNIPKEPLDKFKTMALKSSKEVSDKFGTLMLPTVWEYMNRPAFCELSSKLAPLNPKEQEKLLEEFYGTDKR
jgi:hypothetical protein